LFSKMKEKKASMSFTVAMTETSVGLIHKGQTLMFIGK